MKIIKKILISFIWIILILIASYNIYNLVSIKVLKKELPTVNGYAILEVVSGSMEPTIKVGDLIIINTKDNEYKVDDIITFKDSKGSFVTHRIIDIEDNLYTTKGDNNNSKDQNKLVPSNIKGKYVRRLPNLGKIIASLKSPITLILIFIIGIIICILTSTDANGNVIDLTEDEKEFIAFKEYKRSLNNSNKENKVKKEDTTKIPTNNNLVSEKKSQPQTSKSKKKTSNKKKK